MKIWMRADDTQYVRKISDTKFEVIDLVYLGENYGISRQEIDVQNDYKESDVLSALEGYGYDSLGMISEIYGDSANQIIAECLAESFWDVIDGLYFENEEIGVLYLEGLIKDMEKEEGAV